jgi:BASS family bile acid:Na+ symporter
MRTGEGRVATLAHWVHGSLLWLLVGSYALAACAPEPGLWLRGVDLLAVEVASRSLRLGLPAALLALLMFNAGLGVPLSGL